MKTDSKEHIIVYTFQSMEDPLVKGLMLQYLLELTVADKWIFHLITHEQDAFRLDEATAKTKKDDLRNKNIIWYPVDYHNGRFLLLKKAFDFLKTSWICFQIKRKFKPQKIIGFLPIAAAFASILSPILRLKLITYCFEPHSEYMVDFGIWNRKSLKYILLKKYENSLIEISDKIIVPTSYTKEYVLKRKPGLRTYLLPISVDTDQNRFDPEARNQLRKEWGVGNRKVLLYLGKFGGIYYDIPTFISFLYRLHSYNEFHAIIISSDKSAIERYISEEKLDPSFFTILNFVPYDSISKYISAADMGMVAVPPLPSQKYRTPVKTALYLSCGIPYLVNKGIAEDDKIALQFKVGCVVEDFLEADMVKLRNDIIELQNDPELSSRCRKVAYEERSHHKAVKLMESILKEV